MLKNEPTSFIFEAAPSAPPPLLPAWRPCRPPPARTVPGRDFRRRCHAGADRRGALPRRRPGRARRSRRSCAPTWSAAGCSAGDRRRRAPRPETGQPALTEWRARGADALVGGSVTRLADGRFDVRFKLWDVVKGEELGGQSITVAPRRPAPGRAPHRRLRVREADRREGRVLDPHRLRHALGQPLRACGWPMPTATGRPGGAEQPRADHLAGLVARRQELAYCVVDEAQKAVVVRRRILLNGKRAGDPQLSRSNSAGACCALRRSAVVTLSPTAHRSSIDVARNGETCGGLNEQPGDRHEGEVFGPDGRPLNSASHERGAAASIACRSLGGGWKGVRELMPRQHISLAISPMAPTSPRISPRRAAPLTFGAAWPGRSNPRKRRP